MSALALIVGSILWILVLGSLWLIATRESSSPAAPTNPESTSPSKDSGTADQIADPVPATTKTIKLSFPSRPLPDFTFPECQGGTLSLADLKGKRWLANFVFTRCQGPCPLMTRDISDLHRRVAKSAPDFLFVTFSVDSSYDSAEVLRKYAETFQADPSRWKFLTGDENAIHDLIRRGFSQYVQPNLGEMRKPGFEVAHSNRAVLVNEDGIPVGTWLMTIPE
ncbi:MAG: BsSco, partial [Planctomycetota bacterium]